MLGCTFTDGTIVPNPLEESALTGVQLHLSPISFHLLSLFLKASHDKTRFISQKRNSVTWHMIKIQEQLSEVPRCLRGGVGANPHHDLVDTHWKNLYHIGSVAPVKSPCAGKTNI